MREHLYKGKLLDGGKWVQGYLYRFWDHAYILWGATCPGRFGADIAPAMKEVDPETVCEYTGETDKNDRQIFEGDIFADHFDTSIVGIVRYGKYKSVFNDDAFTGHIGFYIEWQQKENVLRKDLGYWAKESAVIGNIFDNPELLKEET